MGNSCCFSLQLTNWSSATPGHQDALANVTVAATCVTTCWSHFLVLSVSWGWTDTESIAGGRCRLCVCCQKLLRLWRLLRMCLFVGGSSRRRLMMLSCCPSRCLLSSLVSWREWGRYTADIKRHQSPCAVYLPCSSLSSATSLARSSLAFYPGCERLQTVWCRADNHHVHLLQPRIVSAEPDDPPGTSESGSVITCGFVMSPLHSTAAFLLEGSSLFIIPVGHIFFTEGRSRIIGACRGCS